MIHTKMTFEHNPPHSYVDCYRACIASILDLNTEEVPHFMDNCHNKTYDGIHKEVADFIAAYDLSIVSMAFESCTRDVEGLLGFMDSYNPHVFYILVGKSPNHDECDHCVVCLGGKIVNDPSPTNKGIEHPCCDTNLFWVEFFVPSYLTDPRPGAASRLQAAQEH